MQLPSPARAVAALVTGLVFLTANTALVVCAAAHHGRHAADPAPVHASHHDHGQPAPQDTGGATVSGSHTAPPGCTDMSHCGVAVNGVTSQISILQLATEHPVTVPGAPGLGPHPAAFSPPTPPPRA